MKVSQLYFLILLAAMLSACTSFQSQAADQHGRTSPSDQQIEITIAAAADLQFAYSEISGLFEKETGYRVNLVFGSTGQLVQQIENGAPYDLIAAANRAYIVRLVDQNLVLPESVVIYAQGRIVLAVNRASGVRATALSDLLSPEIRHITIANPDHAPYGLAARQALQSAGLWEQLQDKLVLGENVRQALQYIQSGDAEAGIIALSVADVPEVSWTHIDGSLYEPLNQALAIITNSLQPQVSAQFASYLASDTGRAVMEKYGFKFPGESK